MDPTEPSERAEIAQLDWMQHWQPAKGFTLGALYADLTDQHFVISRDGVILCDAQSFRIEGFQKHVRCLFDSPSFDDSVDHQIGLYRYWPEQPALEALPIEHRERVTELRSAQADHRWNTNLVPLHLDQTVTFGATPVRAAFPKAPQWFRAQSCGTISPGLLALQLDSPLPAGDYQALVRIKPYLADRRLLHQRLDERIDHETFETYTINVRLTEPKPKGSIGGLLPGRC